MDYRKLFNYIAIAVFVLVVLYVVYYVVASNNAVDESKANYLEINGIIFTSDGNIIEELSKMKEATKVFAYFDLEPKKKNSEQIYNLALMYTTIFVAMKYNFATYTLDIENKQCNIWDTNKTLIRVIDGQDCKPVLSEGQYRINYAGTDSMLQKPTVVIEGQELYIYSKDAASVVNDNVNFLKVFVPNFDAIEKSVSDMVGRFVSNK